MAAKGVKVKTLESKPQLIEVDMFYYNLYNMCGDSFKDVRAACELYEMSNHEIIEAMSVVSLIANGVA